MISGQYNIQADQGSTLKLFLEYQTFGSTAIDLNSYLAEMQVRRSVNDDNILLFLSGNTLTSAVTGGGSTGYFTGTGGISGTGGLKLNTGPTGVAGHTGGIYINVDPTTMSYVPSGRHLYDLELINGSEITRILQGRFEVTREVTR